MLTTPPLSSYAPPLPSSTPIYSLPSPFPAPLSWLFPLYSLSFLLSPPPHPSHPSLFLALPSPFTPLPSLFSPLPSNPRSHERGKRCVWEVRPSGIMKENTRNLPFPPFFTQILAVNFIGRAPPLPPPLPHSPLPLLLTLTRLLLLLLPLCPSPMSFFSFLFFYFFLSFLF